MTNNSTNAASDTEEIELYPEPCSSTTDEDRINNWLDISVADEIDRGNKLRQNKPVPSPRKDGQPNIVTLTKSSNRYKSKQANKKYTTTGPCGCSYWPTPHITKTNIISKTPSQNISKCRRKQDQNKCTIRTTQLAAPSKRHCLDTWRNKSDLLPDYMVDRLKQYVMDQRPIVQVSDAIDCFQRRKRRCRKKKSRNKINKLQMPHRFAKTTALCLLLAQRIVLILSKPQNIKLNPDLEDLGKIVSDDIARIVYVKNGIKKDDAKQYRSIHNDVTCKVTAWILGILDDLNYKLLDEDLRELEEKEGPVLDFLDDVVEKVLDICVPEPETITILTKSEHSDSSSLVTNDDKNSQDIDSNLTDNEHFRNEVNNIINSINIDSDNLILTDKQYFENEIINMINQIFKDPNDEQGLKYYLHSGYDLTDKEYFENEIYNIISIICEGEYGRNGSESHEVLSEDTSEGSKKVMFSISDIVAGNKILGPTRSKQMKNANKHDYKHKQRNIFFAEPNEHLLSEADEVWPADTVPAHILRPSASVTKSIISLGSIWETDEKYLTPCQADVIDAESKDLHSESENKEVIILIKSLIKMLQSQDELILNEASGTQNEVNKLIASLIKVLLMNKNLSLQDTDSITEKLMPINIALSNKEAVKTILNILNKMRSKPTDLLNLQDLELNDLAKYQPLQALITAYQNQKNQVNTIDEVFLAATETVVTSFESSLLIDKLIDDDISKQQHQDTDIVGPRHKVKTKNKNVATDSIENITQLYKEWKVRLETAPSWFTQSNAHGEPSEDSLLAQTKATNLSKYDINKWCKNLNRGFKNLEIWSDWLQSTCKQTSSLLRKRNACGCFNDKLFKNWIKLRNNVAKDAVLWRKMNKSTHDTFLTFQKYYCNTKIISTKRNSICVCKMKAYYYTTHYRNMKP